MVDGGDQAGVKVEDPDTNAWDKPVVKSSGLEGEAKQYASFCNNFKLFGRNKAYVLAALQLHDPRWTEPDVERVHQAWQGASSMKDIDERIAELCDIAVARAVPGDEATYKGDRGPKWPPNATGNRVGNLWDSMKNGNFRFKEFVEAMVARGCGWSEKEVHALVHANRSEAQRKKFPLASPS